MSVGIDFEVLSVRQLLARRRRLATALARPEATLPGSARCRRPGMIRGSRAFADQVSWLAVNTSKTAVAELMRVAWRSVGTFLERVAAEARREVDLLDGLRRIGIETECS